MSQGLLSSDLAVVRDVAAFSADATRLHKAVAELHALQRQRRDLGASRPNLKAAQSLRDCDPAVAHLWQQAETCWAPLRDLGFPQLAQRLTNETMGEALVIAAHEWQAAPENTPMAIPA